MNKKYNLIDKYSGLISFEGIKVKVESFKKKKGNYHIMPIFLEEQPITWFLYKTEIENCLKEANSKILDVGTGSGIWALLLKKKFINAEVFAIDKNLDAIELAKKNAQKNELEINFLHKEFNTFYSRKDQNKYNVIILTPPYHLYPPEDEDNIPYFARGGLYGQTEFYNQIENSLKLLKDDGLIIFNMMSLGNETYPNYVNKIKKISPNLKLSFCNIFNSIRTETFLNEIYPNNTEYVNAVSQIYPMLYYTSGKIQKNEIFIVEETHNTISLNRTWKDRIELHKDINKF